MRPARRVAFTLIELLTVIAIVALLMAILLPAISRMREGAARTACRNNLRQIGIAIHNFEQQHRAIPAEGGAATANGAPGNSASIFFHLLPYLEQQALLDGSAGVPQNQRLAVFLCPSDSTSNGTPPSGISTGLLALGSYNYNVASPGNSSGGVFPPYSTPPICISLRRAMPDGTSGTIMAGEHVQFCGGGGGGGGSGPGGANPWGTTANKRVFGSLSLAPRTIAVGVNSSICTPPPSPPLGVAWFSASHSDAVNMLMGDASVRSCPGDVDVTTRLVPALTASAGDVWNGFD